MAACLGERLRYIFCLIFVVATKTLKVNQMSAELTMNLLNESQAILILNSCP